MDGFWDELGTFGYPKSWLGKGKCPLNIGILGIYVEFLWFSGKVAVKGNREMWKNKYYPPIESPLIFVTVFSILLCFFWWLRWMVGILATNLGWEIRGLPRKTGCKPQACCATKSWWSHGAIWVPIIRPKFSKTCVEAIYKWYTLQETNISPKNAILKMILLFPRWDMLIPWRVYCQKARTIIVEKKVAFFSANWGIKNATKPTFYILLREIVSP